MSILIKGMEMPKNCQKCWLYIEGACYAKGYRDYRLIMDTAKPDDCPLVEIPIPHGRLGDLDALQKQVENTIQDAHMSLLWKQGMMYARGLVEASKTVIEAEGSET